MNKQRILAEIARTAKANDGKPLGYLRFAVETGIAEHDWKGRHWARWSDALAEAGFPPNAFRVPRYDTDTAIARLASLTRELQRIPAEAEIVLRRRADSTFPSMTVFRRMGSSAERLAKLADYCRRTGSLEDVLALCEPAQTARETTDDDGDSGERQRDEIGFVYLLKSGRFYKIGRSNAAGRRERELQIQLPETAKTIHTIRTDDPPGIEDYWHRRFASKRRNGEWFELAAADVRAFKRRKFQ